jgi:hypothetical protein
MIQEPAPLLGEIHPEVWVAVLAGMALAYFTLGIGWMVSSLFKSRQRPIIPPESAPDIIPSPPVMRIPGQSAEKRGFIRRSGNAIAVFYSVGGSDEAHEGAWVVDRSSGGLCLSLDKSLEVGTVLRIRPTKAPLTAPWIEIQVKSCRQEQSNWELGCQFVTMPGYNTLLLLG